MSSRCATIHLKSSLDPQIHAISICWLYVLCICLFLTRRTLTNLGVIFFFFLFQSTCHFLEDKILCLSCVFWCATVKQRNDILGNDRCSILAKHYAQTKHGLFVHALTKVERSNCLEMNGLV